MIRPYTIYRAVGYNEELNVLLKPHTHGHTHTRFLVAHIIRGCLMRWVHCVFFPLCVCVVLCFIWTDDMESTLQPQWTNTWMNKKKKQHKTEPTFIININRVISEYVFHRLGSLWYPGAVEPIRYGFSQMWIWCSSPTKWRVESRQFIWSQQ